MRPWITALAFFLVGLGGWLMGAQMQQQSDQRIERELATDLGNIHTRLTVLEASQAQAQENRGDIGNLLAAVETETGQVDRLSRNVKTVAQYEVSLDSRLRKVEGK